MKNFKKIGIRTIGIITLLISFNFIYIKFFYRNDIKKYSNIIELLPEPSDSAQILYFAESSNFTTHKFDSDKRKISELVAAHYPNKKLATINKGALHAEIYKVLLQHIPEENQVETVIVTMNLRSFGADWIYSKLETSLQKDIVLLKPGIPLTKRIILSFKGYDLKTNTERHEQVIRHWKKDPLNFPYKFQYSNTLDWNQGLNKKGFYLKNGQKDYDKTALACHYVKSYAFNIKESNPRIKDFDEIIKYCRAKGWNVVFNLMAENTEKAKELVGNDLIFLMERNRDFLIKRYTKMGAIVVDNLNNVHTQYYIDQNWTTEHYTEEGRQIIATNVADSLKNIYPEYYQEIELPKVEENSTYINNCEGKTSWDNTFTLSDEKAYEGNYSCKICKDQPYSITLEKPLKLIPDSTKSRVNLGIMVWQSELNLALKAVVELQGDFTDTKWLIQKFQNSSEKTWEQHYFRFDLSKIDIRDYNYIKVYCSNKSQQPVYIDNWQVRFE